MASGLFTIEAGVFREGELRVVSFRGREWLSRPYRWDVVVDVEGVDFESLEVALLGQPACLHVAPHHTVPRFVHGVTTALRRVDASSDGSGRRLKLRLAPRLALLSRSKVSRVFQDTPVPEIVREVLGEAGIAVEMRLQHRHPPRVYCVQYQESDLDFVSRLLAEEGIFYFFRQPSVALSDPSVSQVIREMSAAAGATMTGLGEVVVLADNAGACQPIAPREVLDVLSTSGAAPTLLYHFGEGAVPDEHHVSRLSRDRSVRSQAVLIRDHDFRRPAVDLTAAQSAVAVAPSGVENLRRRDFPEVVGDAIRASTSRATLDHLAPLTVDPRTMTVYDHHGEDEDPEVTRSAAHVRYEQVRRRVVTAAGESWCRRLSVGYRFHIDGHPDNELNAQYTAIEVQHVGRTGNHDGAEGERASYQNSFVCVPAVAPFRPKPVARVHRQVLETARVVGPPGEEIYTDAHGRIKVQFHWDLAGYNDERSSCWVRVNQAWAGPQWGTQFIPRVGMEVLVSFLGGDQDRPVVLGCLYTGENTPSFGLPGDRTRSGIKTRSSPGGGGHNELSFEDAKGAEQVYLHAERNLREVVRNDHDVQVRNDESIAIDRHQRISVRGNRAEHVDGNQEETVVGNRRVTTQGNVNVITKGSENRWNIGPLQTRVEGRARYHHTSAVDELYGHDYTVRVKGCQTTLVGTTDARMHHGLHVEGSAEQYTSYGTELRSDKEILIRCGKSSILVTPTAIELSAPNLLLHSGDTEITIDEKNLTARAKDTITVRGDKNALVLSQKVQLSTPGALSDRGVQEKITTIMLRDGTGKPLEGQRFRISMLDGSVRTGFLDKDGRAEISAPIKSGEVEFPDVGVVG